MSYRREYQPSLSEIYFESNYQRLGLDEHNRTCHVWSEPEFTTPEVFESLSGLTKGLEVYNEAVRKFEGFPNLMDSVRLQSHREQDMAGLCKNLRLHPAGMEGIFSSSHLSLSSSGYIEPLLPPMRSHKICHDLSRHLLSLEYLIHDFEFMCRNLRPTSRLVLLDIGASWNFHGPKQPIQALLELYRKFGFVFDHIYGFEATVEDPKAVYDTIPEELLSSYHWINVGVSAIEGEKFNPLTSILPRFTKNDFVIVKIDIDKPSVELSLVTQILEDRHKMFSGMIDHLYFEHHVHLGELAEAWAGTMNGTVAESLALLSNLRRQGIPAHYWP